MTGPWRRSTRCVDQGDCVEVARSGSGFLVRDSKLAHSPILAFTPDAWMAFTDAIKAGDLMGGDL